MDVKVEFKQNGKVIKEKMVSSDAGNRILSKYKKSEGTIIKEQLELGTLIIVGGIILGTVAADLANRIASDLDNAD